MEAGGYGSDRQVWAGTVRRDQGGGFLADVGHHSAAPGLRPGASPPLAVQPWLLEVSARPASEMRKSPQLGEVLPVAFLVPFLRLARSKTRQENLGKDNRHYSESIPAGGSVGDISSGYAALLFRSHCKGTDKGHARFV